MYQQLWGYKVDEKLYLGVREQKRLNTTVVEDKEFTPLTSKILDTMATGHLMAHFSSNELTPSFVNL